MVSIIDWVDPLNIIFSSSDEDTDKYNNRRKKRKYWMRPYYLERNFNGGFQAVFKELVKDQQLFYKYTRMNIRQFNSLLFMVEPLIVKQTIIREPLCPELRLAITLRHLATGESQTSLAISYKCSQTSVHRIIKETTKAIIQVLKVKVFPDLTANHFETIANGFQERWNFPNCIGAIDGKHITIQAPAKSGSEFFNYKKTSSIVLMAIGDHDYNFVWCNIGAAGRQSDGGIFRESKFGKMFYKKTLPLPKPRNVTQNFKSVPYVFVADDAFALHENMLKPYKTLQTTEQKIFNYRISRARRIIENCFGILASKWRIFRSPIIADVKLVEDVVQCCVCLHNWLRQHNTDYVTSDLITRDVRGIIKPGAHTHFENTFQPLQPMNKNSTKTAKATRNEFSKYFSGEGQVDWQHLYM